MFIFGNAMICICSCVLHFEKWNQSRAKSKQKEIKIKIMYVKSNYPKACVWKIVRISILSGLIYNHAMQENLYNYFFTLSKELKFLDLIKISGPN